MPLLFLESGKERRICPMRPVGLSPRLQALADQVPQGARFADIGTDHGRLPVWLLEQGRIPFAIACDLREGPLLQAQRTAARHKLSEQLSFRLGDGLVPLFPQEADVIAIAGMGGETIANILSAAPWTRETGCLLLLQPMTSAPELRAWLWRNGYTICQETLVREDRLFVILTVTGGEMEPLTLAEEWAGRQRAGDKSPIREAYLDALIQRAEFALAGLERAGDEEEELRRWKSLVSGLKELKKEWLTWQK